MNFNTLVSLSVLFTFTQNSNFFGLANKHCKEFKISHSLCNFYAICFEVYSFTLILNGTKQIMWLWCKKEMNSISLFSDVTLVIPNAVFLLCLSTFSLMIFCVVLLFSSVPLFRILFTNSHYSVALVAIFFGFVLYVSSRK